MLPLLAEGDRLLLLKTRRVRLGDVIVFRGDRRHYLKRVSALPGQMGMCWGTAIPLDAGEYCVLGDNLAESTDSRQFGPISADRIVGRAILKYFPTIAWIESRSQMSDGNSF